MRKLNPNLDNVLVYFNREVDEDLLEYLKSFRKHHKGSPEIIRLARLGLKVEQGQAPTYYQPPLIPEPQNAALAPPIWPAFQKEPASLEAAESSVDSLEAARRKQADQFGGFD